MTDRPGFFEKVRHFLLGRPVYTLGEADLQLIRQLEQKVDALFRQQVPPSEDQPDQAGSISTASQPLPLRENPQAALDDLAKEVRKLAKTQFKANTLQEAHLGQQNDTIDTLQNALQEQKQQWASTAQLCEQAVQAAQLDILKGTLPVLDGLDAAFATGKKQVLALSTQPQAQQAMIAWLDGVRLARIRLLDLLATHGVKPIDTVGQPFNPHYHVVVDTVAQAQVPDGTIVSQDRAGYATANQVLRFAEVVVARSN